VKRVLAIGAYLLLTGLYLYFLFGVATPQRQETWLAFFHSFGRSPFAGTAVLFATARWWWTYVLAALIIFVYGMLIRKRYLWPLLYATFMAALWVGFVYGPVIALGSVV
jgi:hypothetical protein